MMDKYIAAHFDLFRSAERAFNYIEADGKLVRKTIYTVEKGRQEVFFYKNIPQVLKPYFPKFIGSRSSKNKVSYEIELIPAYDVSVWYLRGTLSPDVFTKFLDEVEIFFSRTPRMEVPAERWRASAKKLIVDKLDSRWSEYTRAPVFKQLRGVFRDQHGADIAELKRNVKRDLLIRLRDADERALHFAHGDLCFSNILMSPAKKLKLIDPKGAGTRGDLFITLYYDLAKLSHSINGNYDGVLSGGKVPFATQKKIFSRWVRRLGYDMKFVRLIESSLFLSLLPLHGNRPQSHKDFFKAALAAYKSSQ